MIFFRDDRTYTSYSIEKPENLVANYFANGVIMYHSIYKANSEGIEMPLFYTNETRRYINIRYAHVTNNWDLSNGGTYGQKIKYYEAI